MLLQSTVKLVGLEEMAETRPASRGRISLALSMNLMGLQTEIPKKKGEQT